jgi:hypothetical protein
MGDEVAAAKCRLALPYPVLPPSAREQAATRMGISVEEVMMILEGTRWWFQGRVIDESAPEWSVEGSPIEADQLAGAGVFPADLVIYDIEVDRDPRQRLEQPISSVDLAAADVVRLADFLTWAQSNNAPRLTHYRFLLQSACEEILTCEDATDWRPRLSPVSELQLDSAGNVGAEGTATAAGTPPPHAWIVSTGEDAINMRACDFVADGYVVHFGFASVVLSHGGEVRDVFPSNCLLTVGSSSQFLMLSKTNRFFDLQPYVRDVVEHRWVTGSLPPELPRHCAGIVHDGSLVVVVDYDRGVYYDLCPRAIGVTDTVRLSACGRFVWDSVTFVREALSGRPVLDARWIEGDVISFARTADGWRFVMHCEPADEESEEDRTNTLRFVTETGDVVRKLDVGDWDLARWDVRPLALSADGTRLLQATDVSLTVCSADTGEPVGSSIDLRPLYSALELPNNAELWAILASTYATPGIVARETPDTVLADLADTFAGATLQEAGVTRNDIAEAIAVASNWPQAPQVLPLLG